MWKEPPAYQAANRALREIVLLTHFASNARQHRCGIFTGWLIIEPDLCTTEHLELWSSIVSNCNGNWAHNISSPINWYDRILQYWHARQKRNQNWKKNPAASNLVNPKLEKLFQYLQGLLTSSRRRRRYWIYMVMVKLDFPVRKLHHYGTTIPAPTLPTTTAPSS